MPQENQTLTASNGTWSGGPTSYAYQWQDCTRGGCSNISGAISQTYTLRSADVGDTVDVVVTAENAGGAGSATSARTATVTASSIQAPGLPIPPMPVISHGLPTYGEGTFVYSPSSASSGNCTQATRCTPPCAVDIDLSSAPLAQRQQALVAWYNDCSQFDAAATNGNVYYNNPRDYTIDANTAAGGGSPPASGWSTLATVTGNPLNTRQHIIDLGGANWIRMRVTAVNGSSGNTDATFSLDVHDASQAAEDSYLLIGDSITGEMTVAGSPNFAQDVNTEPAVLFSERNRWIFRRWTSATPLAIDPTTSQAYIDELLADYPSHFVSVDFGTNDANEGGIGDFTANMTTLINKIIAAGRVPIIRQSIPWGCTGKSSGQRPCHQR